MSNTTVPRPRLFTLLRLQLKLIRGQVAAAAPWQRSLFLIAAALIFLLQAMTVPRTLRASVELDGGIIFGSLTVLGVLSTTLGIHLILSADQNFSYSRSQSDPLDLLPISPVWAFYLAVAKEVCIDPVGLLFIPSTLLGISLASHSPQSPLAALTLAPFLLAVVAAIRLATGRIAQQLFSFRMIRVQKRLVTYLWLLLTVTMGTVAIFDAVTLARVGYDGMEPIDLLSTRVLLPVYQFTQAHLALCRADPLAWPVSALMGGPDWNWWWWMTAIGGLGLVALLAFLNARLPVETRLPDRSQGDSTGHRRLARYLIAWLPISTPALVQLEVEIASIQGLFGESILQGGLLLGAIFVLLRARESLAGSFLDAFRLLLATLTMLFTTSAIAVARSTAGIALRLTLPMTYEQILLSKLPVVTLCNAILVAPAAIALPLLVPPTHPASTVAAMVLLVIVVIGASLAAVAAGIMVASLGKDITSFSQQLLALFFCALAVAPVTLVAVSGNNYAASGGVVISGLLIAGLWQKALSRLRELTLPPDGHAPSALLGDAALASVLYVLGGSTLMLVLQRGLFFLPADNLEVLASFILQVLVIRYIWMYLTYREKVASEAPAVRGRPRDVLGGLLAGVAMSGLAILYGAFMYRVIGVERDQAAGGALVRLAGQVRDYPLFAVLALVTGAVLAPVSEELLFRRMLFRGLLESTGATLVSALISAVLFACIHPAVGFPMFLLVGLVSALLYWRTGTLAASIGFHIAYNATQLVLLFKGGLS